MSILGKLSVVGPSGVSCIIGCNGFSNTGNSGRFKLKSANWLSKSAITSAALSKGFATPIFAAFCSKALYISLETLYGLKIFSSIALTSAPETLSSAP